MHQYLNQSIPSLISHLSMTRFIYLTSPSSLTFRILKATLPFGFRTPKPKRGDPYSSAFSSARISTSNILTIVAHDNSMIRFASNRPGHAWCPPRKVSSSKLLIYIGLAKTNTYHRRESMRLLDLRWRNGRAPHHYLEPHDCLETDFLASLDRW